METTININENAMRAEIQENNASWGKGVSVKIFDDNGDILYKFKAYNHPEFDEFEKHQSMDLLAISNVVKNRFESGIYNMADFQKAKEAGITLILSINGDHRNDNL